MLDITTQAAWGEFIGGIAVGVSLIYLAAQIRQNSKLLRSSTATITLEASNAVSRLQAEDPVVAGICYAGLENRSSLSDSDRQRFDAMASMLVAAFDQKSELFFRKGY